MSDPYLPLQLDGSALAAVRDALAERIKVGLSSEGQEIKALPAYLTQPDPGVSGRAIVVDTGGTNMRAALVELRPGATPIVSDAASGEVPRDPGRPIGAEEFFHLQAELVRELNPPPDLPVGYCFSYPTTNERDGDATLLRWTKGIQIEGVEGSRVGSALSRALESLDVHPGPLRVLNDTVAALMAGAWLAQGESESIGLIVGTGNNMAAFLQREGSERMAVNLESGNFFPPGLSLWDDELDALSDNPGQQRIEKAVSGLYLPHLFRRIFPDSSLVDPALGSQALGELRQRGEHGPETEVAGLLLDRSADLVGAAIAGVCQHLPESRPVCVIAEGSLFWKTPGYRERVTTTAKNLLGPSRGLSIEGVEHANLIGSACAALSEQ